MGGAAAVKKARTYCSPILPNASLAAGRLQGTLLGVGSNPCLPLSSQGHARYLVEEATNKENLGQMYIWWMAWF